MSCNNNFQMHPKKVNDTYSSKKIIDQANTNQRQKPQPNQGNVKQINPILKPKSQDSTPENSKSQISQQNSKQISFKPNSQYTNQDNIRKKNGNSKIRPSLSSQNNLSQVNCNSKSKSQTSTQDLSQAISRSQPKLTIQDLRNIKFKPKSQVTLLDASQTSHKSKSQATPLDDSQASHKSKPQVAPLDASQASHKSKPQVAPLDASQASHKSKSQVTLLDASQASHKSKSQATPLDASQTSHKSKPQVTPLDASQASHKSKSQVTPLDTSQASHKSKPQVTPLDDSQASHKSKSQVTPLDASQASHKSKSPASQQAHGQTNLRTKTHQTKNHASSIQTNEKHKAKSHKSTKSQTKAEPNPDLDPMTDLDVDAPPEFLCPLTMSIMKDPVLMPDGQTYEREAIKKALSSKLVSPVTREPMTFKQAKANHALKSSIDKYVQDHISEIKEEPTIIDPNNIFKEAPVTSSEIPIATIDQFKLETFSAVYDSNSMHITIKPESIASRLPVSIIAVIDTSGSMSFNCALENVNVCDEGMGEITTMQLVQYSLKTIISTLDSSDQITIIDFNDFASVRASAVKMDINGKQNVNKIIDAFEEDGCTNLWDGIEKGIDEALKQQNNKMNTSILVFTDGEPNVDPPDGLIPTLKNKLKGINVFFSISMFGFGQSIDADLLRGISEIGNGVYGYCPDASMVGTIFINYISNLISEISPLNILTVNKKSYNVILYNGSSTNIVVQLMKKDNPKSFKIELKSVLTNQTFSITKIKKLDMNDENALNIFRDQKYRYSLINLISKIDDSTSTNHLKQNVIDLFNQLKNEKNRTQFMNYLMIDLYNDDKQHGEIERACRKKNFQTWGKNYLFSMLRFHFLEQCGNFRDMSLQLYGNEIFRKFRKFGNKVFMNLPLPQSRPSKHFYGDDDDNDDNGDDDDNGNDDNHVSFNPISMSVRSQTMRVYNSRSKSSYI